MKVIVFTKDIEMRYKEKTFLVFQKGQSGLTLDGSQFIYQWQELPLDRDDWEPVICPECQEWIRLGKQKEYETLTDHVMLKEPKLRPTFICSCPGFRGVDGGNYDRDYISKLTDFSFGNINAILPKFGV